MLRIRSVCAQATISLVYHALLLSANINIHACVLVCMCVYFSHDKCALCSRVFLFVFYRCCCSCRWQSCLFRMLYIFSAFISLRLQHFCLLWAWHDVAACQTIHACRLLPAADCVSVAKTKMKYAHATHS